MRRMIASMCLGLSLSACLPIAKTATPSPAVDILATGWDDRGIFGEGLVSSARPVLDELPHASIYHIEITIQSDLRHFDGSEEVRFTNDEDGPLDEIIFRLYPNILGGEMTIRSALVDGAPADLQYGLGKSRLAVSLKEPLLPGSSTVIRLDFSLTIPDTVELNYGVQAYYDDVLALAHVYPMIAVHDEQGWNAEIPPQSGDLTYADMSFFIVRVSAPAALVLAGSGREVSRVQNDDHQTVTYAAGPARDFYLAASPNYEVFTRRSGEVSLRFYAPAASADGAVAALDVAQRAVEDFSSRYAPYPYTELDMVATPTQALGIEYPGMIAIADRILLPESRYLEATLAHEVAHQWFYNLVGNDQLDQPWLDESLAQFVTLQYFTDEYGAAESAGFREHLMDRWSAAGSADIPVGLPVASYSDQTYSAIVYGRGALFFEALREEIGTEKFDEFIREYTKTFSWGIATSRGLQLVAERTCACDLTSLFDRWIY